MEIVNQFITQSIMTLGITEFNLKKLTKTIENLLIKKKIATHQAIILNIQAQNLTVSQCAMLVELMSQFHLIVIGIQSNNVELIKFAHLSNLAIFNKENSKTNAHLSTNVTDEKFLPLIIESKISSQEQVYAKNQDLIILKIIKPHAEVLSDQNIAIYATAQGKLFAGISGNKSATIFIRDFQASLVSIAGIYKTFDHIPASLYQKSVLIYLKDDVLIFKTDDKL